MKKNNNIKVAAILGVSIIIAAIILSSSGTFRSSKDHCYYKVYEQLKSSESSDGRAAHLARARCK